MEAAARSAMENISDLPSDRCGLAELRGSSHKDAGAVEAKHALLGKRFRGTGIGNEQRRLD